MAALPLFGIGQRFIPVADVGRRRYVFALLLVYVAAALSLLVTTSFLNLRRYLRQRRVEMPLSIAGTWVGLGAGIILLVMTLVLLIPRPGAEVAISRVPWQATSPGGHSASRNSVMRDGGEKQGEQKTATTGEKMSEEGQPGELQPTGESSDVEAKSDEPGGGTASKSGNEEGKSRESRDSNQQASNGGGQWEGQREGGESKEGGRGEGKSGGSSQQSASTNASESKQSGKQDSMSEAKEQTNREANEPRDSNSQVDTAANVTDMHQSTPQESPLSRMTPMIGGLAGLFKILLYIVLAIAVIYFAWRYRREIAQAIADILRQLRELFGGKRAAAAAAEQTAAAAAAPRPSFHEFRDPFAGGQHGKLPPEELVRYTFAAFEAWANDRGSPRSPDCTPQELVGMAVEPETPMYAEARRLLRLYSQVAYASQRVPREAANELRTLWQIMRTSHAG
jgi:hypothetical protein